MRRRKIEIPTRDTQPQFELGDTAEDIKRRRRRERRGRREKEERDRERMERERREEEERGENVNRYGY